MEDYVQTNIFSQGQSRDTLSISKKRNRLVVIKTFSNKDYRSKKNIEKQLTFIPNDAGRVKTCRIFESSDDRLEMEYVFGSNGAGILSNLHVDAFQKFIENINNYLENIILKANTATVHRDIFLTKFEQIILNSNNQIKPLLIENMNICKSLLKHHETIKIPLGQCHGDFTFSNMIVSENGDICLIDFLETFLETPLQDIAKLMQELKYYWSLRYSSSSHSIKAKTSAVWMLSNSQVVARAYRAHPIAMNVLEILCLARIAPYVKDDCTMTWLIRALKQTKEI